MAYTASTPAEILDAIRAMDPDGWETQEPTAADRIRFEERVRDTFGDRAWTDYHA